MQSTAMFLQGQPQPPLRGVLHGFRVAASLVVAGAVLPTALALAQAPADATAGEKTQAAASQSEPDVHAPWNRRRTPATGVDGQLRRLAADLKLDAAQQAKIRPVLVARSEQMQRLQHDTHLTSAERRQRALAIGDHSAEQIRAQLTDAQRAQYIQPRSTVAQAPPAARRGGMADPRAAAPRKGATP